MSDISFFNSVNRDSHNIINCQKISLVSKKKFKVIDFLSKFEQVKRENTLNDA